MGWEGFVGWERQGVVVVSLFLEWGLGNIRWCSMHLFARDMWIEGLCLH